MLYIGTVSCTYYVVLITLDENTVIFYLVSYSKFILFLVYSDMCLYCGYKLRPCAYCFNFVCTYW